MREDEPEVVAASCDQDVVQVLRQVQIVLELVEIEHEVAAFGNGLASAFHRRLPHTRHQEGSEEATCLLAEQTFRQRDQQDAAVVHAAGKVDRGARLAHDVAHCRAQQDRAELVEHRTCFLQSLRVGLLVPQVPKGLKSDRVVEAFDQDPARIALKKQQGNLAQAGVRAPQ